MKVIILVLLGSLLTEGGHWIADKANAEPFENTIVISASAPSENVMPFIEYHPPEE